MTEEDNDRFDIDYGEKMPVAHPNPDYEDTIWFEDTRTLVRKLENTETGEVVRERFKLVSEEEC